ncbi:MAG: DUF2127 domain-containing protein [Candidatus Freyarchaeum deiterrae]
MTEIKAWAVLGIIGGIYAVLAGLVILFLGVGLTNTINSYYMYMLIFPDMITIILQLIQQLSPTLASFTFGPLAPILGFAGASGITLAGIVIAGHGILILIGGALLWGERKAGAALMAVIGFIGLLAFNLGGLLGLVAGIAGWFEK